MPARCPRCFRSLPATAGLVCPSCGYHLRFHPLVPAGLLVFLVGVGALVAWAFAPLPDLAGFPVPLADLVLNLGTAALFLGTALAFLGAVFLTRAARRAVRGEA